VDLVRVGLVDRVGFGILWFAIRLVWVKIPVGIGLCLDYCSD
jgi:hypothetical protein